MGELEIICSLCGESEKARYIGTVKTRSRITPSKMMSQRSFMFPKGSNRGIREISFETFLIIFLKESFISEYKL
jgi:hypothetical protein